MSPVELLKKGDKVGQSEAALLQKLNIEPFSYALVVHKIFDSGAIFTAEVLDLTDDMLASKMSAGLGGLAAICLATGYPTMASIPHSIGNAYKVLVSIAVECEDYSFKKADSMRHRCRCRKQPGTRAHYSRRALVPEIGDPARPGRRRHLRPEATHALLARVLGVRPRRVQPLHARVARGDGRRRRDRARAHVPEEARAGLIGALLPFVACGVAVGRG